MKNNVLQFLWRHLKRLKWLFFAMILVVALGEVCTQVGLFYSSRIVGVLSESGEKADIFQKAMFFAILFAAYSLARGILHNLMSFFEARFLPLFNIKISKALFNQAHKHSLQFFSEEMSGRVAQKVRQTITEASDFYFNMQAVFHALLRMAIAFYFVAKIDWTLTLVFIGFFTLYFGLLFYNTKGMVAYSEASHDTSTIANGVLVDTMFNHTLVRNFSRIFFERLNYFKRVHNWVKVEKKLYLKEANMFMLQGVLRAVLQMSFLLVPLFYWLNDRISVADFVLAESLATYLTLYVMDIVMKSARMFRNWGGIKDGLDFLYRPFHVVDKENAAVLKVRKASIVFENVSFGYKSDYETMSDGEKAIIPLLFRHFNLEIKAGEKIGLAGHSGSGKSSIVKILSRYYDISDGQILINKTNIAEVTQDSLRQNISIIPQDPSLFNRTIMENIRYGRMGATEQDVIKAAKKAYCHDFIMALPKGYETRVGERGVNLSGGERQRIAIARAILKNAPILILDEATSALDSESELYIQKALGEVMKNKTVIAIAHRLSTLREMDRLIVLDDGKIIEEGSHTALMRKKGAYYEFYQLQKMNFRR